jgi:molybdate transport system substrate-binding protein
MRSAGVLDAVQAKLVLGENITQAAQFVESGSADVGLIARSLARAPAMRAKGRAWEVPGSLYPPLEQAGVVTAPAGDRLAATSFAAYLQSADARRVLQSYGFELPER